MIAVIFEVEVPEEQQSAYLAYAATLRTQLEQMDGFISVERFTSIQHANKLLSLSYWRDEAAVKAWRNQATHRASQVAGRNGVFADYRLRVATILRDYSMRERDEAPADSRQHHG